jgi:SAM-dependent methyltransferase
MNDRTVEVPLILERVRSNSARRILELGNVLSHYIRCDHDIVDKSEKAEGVINEDIVNFKVSRPYDLIVSISTLEHVGWDEKPRDPRKVLNAFENLTSLLAPGGELMLTFPLGYNPELDRSFRENELHMTERHYLKRISRDNKWKEVGWDEVRDAKYGRPFGCANAVVVATIRRDDNGKLI